MNINDLIQGSIDIAQVKNLKDWFEHYTHSFQDNDPEIQHNLHIKILHTERVCKEILYLGKELNLSTTALHIAELIALLHDVGRFDQYSRYKTFKDSKSQDHALLGLNVVKKHHLLDDIDPDLRDIIIKAITYHNQIAIPVTEKDPHLFFEKLIRDADKLDIWKVVLDYYYRKGPDKNNAIELGFPDTPGISDLVMDALMHQRIVHIDHIQNLNDFKLLQMAWVYDINFDTTKRLIQERAYLKKLRSVLPVSDDIDTVYTKMLVYLNT
jgi:hypothetical protein